MSIMKNQLKTGRDKIFSSVTRKIDEIRTRAESIEQQQLVLSQRINDLSNQYMNSGVLRISESEIIVKIFNGLKIYLDTKDISLVPHLALDGIWEAEITQAWIAVIKPGDTVFDVGANFGYFGLLASHLVGKKNAKVVLIEPNPHLVRYIKKTLDLNWYNEQAIVEGCAVTDREGFVTLNILKDYVASSTVQSLESLEGYLHDKMHIELDEAIKVPAITIDGYCKKQGIKTIDVMKMDIEGFEDKAYAGMAEIVKSSPNLKLFIEFTKDGYEKPKAFYEKMCADFADVAIINEAGKLVSIKGQDYEKVVGSADDWVMLVFSKERLAK